MAIDFSLCSENMSGDFAACAAQLHTDKSQRFVTSFEIELPPDLFVSPPKGSELICSVIPLADPNQADTSDGATPADTPTPAEQLMWMGVTLQFPVEMQNDDTIEAPIGDSTPLVTCDSHTTPDHELSCLNNERLEHFGETRGKAPADHLPASIDPVIDESEVDDSSLIDLEVRREAASQSARMTTLSSAGGEKQWSYSSLGDAAGLHMVEQAPSQPTFALSHHSVDSPPAEPEMRASRERPAGLAPELQSVVHTGGPLETSLHSPHALPAESTLPTRSPASSPVGLRTELSEVIRHVRTMATERETRSTIQLEPAHLGRLTVELIDAPDGLRVEVTADDPAITQFLERNVQLLESEARIQGAGHMSFSVGVDVSSGQGRGDQRQSDAEGESPFLKNFEWKKTQLAKSRSHRELDTNA